MNNKTGFENMQSIKEILNVLEYDSNDIVYLAGSLIEGIGNRYSDLDIYVVKDDINSVSSTVVEYDKGGYKVGFAALSDGMKCDIEYWPLSTAEALIEQIRDIDFKDLTIRARNQLKVGNYSLEELYGFVHRFVNSQPIYNEDKYMSLKKKLNLQNFCKLMVRIFINDTDNMYDDVIGMMEANQTETALLVARNMLVKAVQGYIYSQNYTIDREKWIFEKMKIISKDGGIPFQILDNFYKLYFYTHLKNKDDIYRNIEDILNFYNKIIEIIAEEQGGI